MGWGGTLSLLRGNSYVGLQMQEQQQDVTAKEAEILDECPALTGSCRVRVADSFTGSSGSW